MTHRCADGVSHGSSEMDKRQKEERDKARDVCPHSSQPPQKVQCLTRLTNPRRNSICEAQLIAQTHRSLLLIAQTIQYTHTMTAWRSYLRRHLNKSSPTRPISTKLEDNIANKDRKDRVKFGSHSQWNRYHILPTIAEVRNPTTTTNNIDGDDDITSDASGFGSQQLASPLSII